MWILLGLGIVLLVIACTTVNVSSGKGNAETDASLKFDRKIKLRRDAPKLEIKTRIKDGK